MQYPTRLTLIAMAAAASLLVGCNRNDEGRTVGQNVDRAVTQVEQGAEKAKDATVQAVDRVADKTKDIGITASVKAELARDTTLSALQINVDTVDGRVTLQGTAPDTAARERATSLANSVTGVLGVDNQLSVAAR